MSMLIPGLVALIGLVFSVAVVVFYLGCLGATMAAFNHGRIVWGSLTFFLPPLSLLFALRHRAEADWSFGFIWKGGLVVLLIVGGVWLGMQLLPEHAAQGASAMGKLLPLPAGPVAQ